MSVVSSSTLFYNSSGVLYPFVEGKEVVTKISKYANLFKLRHCKAFYLSSTCFQRAGGRFNLGSWRKFIEILSYPGLKCTTAQTVASLWRKCPKNGNKS